MENNVFKDIKEMEEDYESEIMEAQRQAQRIIEDAKNKAIQDTARLSEELRQKKETQIEDAKSAIKIRKDKLLKQAQVKFDELRVQAERNKDKAKKFVLQKFEEEVME